MSLLGISRGELSEKGGLYTASEIEQQPALWQKIATQVTTEMPRLKSFLQKTTEAQRVILTGAGTSAFIGLSLQRAFSGLTGKPAQAIPTTDIVSHPHDCFLPGENVLLVSFARSGNSPESIGTVTLADKICGSCFHLIITCSESGKLANYQTDQPKYVFQLPKESNDKSLAMTSSYSGMLLAGLLLAKHRQHEQSLRQVDLLCAFGKKSLREHAPMLREIATMPFRRAVFLGAGSLYGVAMESHLKLQELTDGQIICKHDTFLGFRHGPKAVVNGETLMFYLISNAPYPQRYALDLLGSMSEGKPPMLDVALSETSIAGFGGRFALVFSGNGQSLEEEFLAVCAVLPGQMLGFYKSLDLGFSPDTPSQSGAINRVVQGVKIYPFRKVDNF